MYYPVQIPFVLNKEFSDAVTYSEQIIAAYRDFVICLWEMRPRTREKKVVENIIITDGCIDLVVDHDAGRIGFAGMSKTDFHYKLGLPAASFGARLKPGAFYALTGIPASNVMDTFLPLADFDAAFDAGTFFALPYAEAKVFFTDYIGRLIQGNATSAYTKLFDKWFDDIPASVPEIYETLAFSPRQSQRLFYKHYGMTPQTALCILRFQKCLGILVSDNAKPCDALNSANYYDQAHFIKDFRRCIGITPSELVRRYR